MRIIETLRDVFEGIKALPACAEAVRELTAFHRESDEAVADVRAFVGDMALQARIDDLTKERDALQRKLDWLLRPRLQSEKPCPFPEGTSVLWSSPQSNGRWVQCDSDALNAEDHWRPLDLTHYTE